MAGADNTTPSPPDPYEPPHHFALRSIADSTFIVSTWIPERDWQMMGDTNMLANLLDLTLQHHRTVLHQVFLQVDGNIRNRISCL